MPRRWSKPLGPHVQLWPTHNSDSHEVFPLHATGLPLGQHVGAFGTVRKHHTHEGVDLYTLPFYPVHAVEDGYVVGMIDFTGGKVGSPWWNDTKAIMVEGESGVVVYGEIKPRLHRSIRIGDKIAAGYMVGRTIPVLKEFKGRPTCMLHLELYKHGTREVFCWDHNADGTPRDKPDNLLDPTPFLMELCYE